MTETSEEVIAALTVKLTECTGALIEQSSRLGVVMAERDGLRLALSAERKRTDALVTAVNGAYGPHWYPGVRAALIPIEHDRLNRLGSCVTPATTKRGM